MNAAWPREGRFPEWAVQDGVFAPMAIPASNAALGLEAVFSRLGLPPRCSVYLRGSRLEEAEPHPLADLDLVVVADNVADKKASWAILHPWALAQPMQVDLTGHVPQALESCAAYRLLLATRSMRIFGPPRTWTPVPANEATMRTHAQRYHVHLAERGIKGETLLRVNLLKRLTRSFGVWGFCEGLPFTRDIATCLRRADVLAPEAAQALRHGWDDMREQAFFVGPALEALARCPLFHAWPALGAVSPRPTSG